MCKFAIRGILLDQGNRILDGVQTPRATKRGIFLGGGHVLDRCNAPQDDCIAFVAASGVGCAASTIEQSVRGSDAALRHSTVTACFHVPQLLRLIK